ncbi:MAG: sodium:proton antiporter NhaD [Chlamydiia bacterium]|nr:sodium:proton antiporter NhaD [Chlamydiia bacterium]
MAALAILTVFILGYLAIAFEFTIKVNKTAVALSIAVIGWSIYFLSHDLAVKENLTELLKNLSDVSQIIFFLLAAMTIVELIDSHKGFNTIIEFIHTRSKKYLIWIVAAFAFCLSALLDNLTTTILMVSIIRKLIPTKKDRFLFGCIIVVAANAGGAWTPIGDVTTTMLWINGQLSTLAVMKNVFMPSLVSVLVPLWWFARQAKGKYAPVGDRAELEAREPGSHVIFWCGMCAFIFVPLFHWATELPPFMGMLLSLALLWFVTDVLHHKYESRQHLRVPYILTKIDVSNVLFFLGILLAIDALDIAGVLMALANWLNVHVPTQEGIVTIIGILSAIIDNVPLVAATMSMYDLSQFPMDSKLWLMIAYAAGTGGSILLIGSSAGVALMGMEKVDFFSYMRKVSMPVLVGYLAGMSIYLLF